MWAAAFTTGDDDSTTGSCCGTGSAGNHADVSAIAEVAIADHKHNVTAGAVSGGTSLHVEATRGASGCRAGGERNVTRHAAATSVGGAKQDGSA